MMKCSTLLSLLVACSLAEAPQATAQIHGGQKVEHRSHLGANGYYQVGRAVLGPGDLNGDGVEDYLIATPGYNSLTGRVRAHSGATGQALWTEYGVTSHEQFGYALATLDDINGDGAAEVAVSAPYFNHAGGTDNGKIHVLSGRTGTTLQIWNSNNSNSYLGQELAAADLNGDGQLDLISGAPKVSSGSATSVGKIIAIDLANGQVLSASERTGSQDGARLGASLANVGDWNGDGCDDLAVGAPGIDSNGLSANGRVNVFNGAVLAGVSSTPLLLRQFAGVQDGESLGSSLAQVGDVDRDGFKELLIGSPRWSDLTAGINDTGRATLRSGRTGQLMRQYFSPHPQEEALFGSPIAAGRDIDHDGFRDFLIGSLGHEEAGDTLGAVYAISSRTHGLLQEHFGEVNNASFGAAIASIGDIDGDLTHEFVVGASGETSTGVTFGGTAYVLGREAFLSQSALRVDPGDTVDYAVDFPGVAGQYKILVSLLGAGPTNYTGVNVPLGPLHIPITSTAYPSFTSGFYGILDADGKANASLSLPITTPPLMIFTAAVKSYTGTSILSSSVVQILEVR